MQLNKLEIYGFKSFADKTVVDFPQGITAIVGPNGSGKSNVADAIRWVLGEQSTRELRGEKVEDFIFNGSVERHKLGYAQVALTFDNSDGYLATDFNEITVTRKAYRSGESEFYINKSRCRLKDIQELFLDTGLTRNSFALVGQGQVEAIVEARPKDRRAFFDEAAGINKYKAKKEETLRKIERTELDLSRATDIANELEQRIEPLRLAKEKAEKYQALADDYQKDREKLLYSEFWQLSQAVKAADTKKTQKEDELVLFDKKYSQLEAEEALAKEKLGILEEELSLKQNALYQTEQTLQSLTGDLRVLQTRKDNLLEKAYLLKQNVKEKENQQMELTTNLKKATLQKDNLNEELMAIDNLLAKKQAELEGYLEAEKNNQKEIENLKDLLFEKSQKISATRNQILQIERELELTNTALEKVANSLREKQRELKEKETDLTNLKDQIKLQEEKATTIMTARTSQKDILLIKEKEYQLKMAEFQNAKESLKEKKAQLKILEATEAELYGYYDGVKALLKAPLTGVIGVVAKLIDVPGHLTKAVEAVLQAQLQGIVTQTDLDAEKAIRYLKERRLGKATFYPLNLLTKRSISKEDNELLNGLGVLGLLKDFLGLKTELSILAEHLGGNTIITDNLENARLLAKRCQSRYRIVTLDGEVIWSGGTMTGGAEKEERVGLLKRQALIKQLKVETPADSAKIIEIEEAVNKLPIILNKETEKLKDLDTELQNNKLRQESYKVSLKALLSSIESLRLDFDLTVKEEKELQNKVESLNARQQLLIKEEKLLIQEDSDLRANLKNLSSLKWTEEPKIRDEYQGIKDRQIRAKERVNYAQKEKEGRTKELEAIFTEYQELKKRLREVFLEEIAERLNTLEKEKLKTASLLKSEVLRRALNQKKTVKTELINKITDYERDIKALRPQVFEAEKSLREASTELARLEGQYEACLKKAEELELSLDKVDQSMALPKEERNRLSQAVRRLDREISALGPVNIGAIAEYQEVFNRYSFLKNQIADLNEARDDLSQVLARLDQTSRIKFNEAFLKIKTEFEKLFKTLFGGGEASLILEEGDVLEAGIEIKAQPPGKKFQSISLLSGGEKALTAIALIFAAISVCQVPFYLFDEIDAPLDEANLERYVDLIKKKAIISQLIIITHRRRSMEAADLLYGVTMEEKGVSKILSLRLEDEQAAAAIED